MFHGGSRAIVDNHVNKTAYGAILLTSSVVDELVDNIPPPRGDCNRPPAAGEQDCRL